MLVTYPADRGQVLRAQPAAPRDLIGGRTEGEGHTVALYVARLVRGPVIVDQLNTWSKRQGLGHMVIETNSHIHIIYKKTVCKQL